MFDLTPDPVAIQLGPLPIYWYGIGYAVGLALVYIVLTRLARRAGEDPDIVGNGMIVVAVAALVGGRAYHVIDQWSQYENDLLLAFLPVARQADGSLAFSGFTGLGVYGGIIAGTVAAFAYARHVGVSFLRWADIVAPGLFVMQAVARWGNFFNQELYGTPTDLPWGIPIDCAHRIAAYPCDSFPEAVTRFHPLFLYESVSGVLGAAVLVYLGFRLRHRLRPGDLLFTFFIWYGVVRFLLEPFRQDNWLLNGIPTAQIVSVAFIVVGLVALAWRHRPGHGPDRPAANQRDATWGAAGATVPGDGDGVADEEAVEDVEDVSDTAAAADPPDARPDPLT